MSETELSYYRARYYDPNAGRFVSEDPAKWSGDGTNFYAYALNRPTVLVDPLGLLAEVYCERIPSAGSHWWEKAGLTLSQAMHCWLRVKTDCIDETFEITGPINRKATPHKDPFNPNRGGRKFKVYVPPGLKPGEFEQRLIDAYGREVSRLPDYNASGPNSNTFVHQIVLDAGGYNDFPIGAYGSNDGIQY